MKLFPNERNREEKKGNAKIITAPYGSQYIWRMCGYASGISFLNELFGENLEICLNSIAKTLLSQKPIQLSDVGTAVKSYRR